jgi:hypothetical protein
MKAELKGSDLNEVLKQLIMFKMENHTGKKLVVPYENYKYVYRYIISPRKKKIITKNRRLLRRLGRGK